MSAQYQIGLIPRVSPDRSVSQKIGFTEVTVKYGSPAVKNRQIMGELVAYDQVWRAGANDATTITFSRPVIINNSSLDSGRYAFFIVPRANKKWTAIFNKMDQQWGAFRYNQAEDALRIDLLPRRTNDHFENLTYSLGQLGFEFGSILLNWGTVELEIPFETHYVEEFKNSIEAWAEQQPDHLKWVVYVQGAEHLEQIKSDLETAKKWIHQAETLMNSSTEWNKQFYPKDYIIGHLKWIKAQLLVNEERYSEAISLVEELKQLSNPLFYHRKKEAERIDEVLKVWKAEKN
ncbi:MAG: hypothetical protein Sapg2KO_47520 [Saprospiraceae bacterium]